MPPPEILRRCSVCGAASRPGAMFCPQCGNATRQPNNQAEATEMAPTEALPEPGLDPRLQTRKLQLSDERALPKVDQQRKVDRQRKAATVVLDEGAFDPSFRFVVVAAILFVLFVVLLILSKVIN